MLTHIVLFNLKDGVDPAEVVAKLASMDGRIEQLRSIEVGANVIPADSAYDIGLVTRFDSLAAHDEYQAHPYHQEIKAYMGGVASGSARVDFES